MRELFENGGRWPDKGRAAEESCWCSGFGAIRPPHLPIGGFDAAGKTRRVHQRGLLHTLAKRCAQLCQSREIGGEVYGNLHELLGRLCGEFSEAEV